MLTKRLGKTPFKDYDSPKVLRFTTVIIVRAYTRVFLKFRLNTNGKLPQGPKIFAINHPTATDPFVIGCMFPNARILITNKAFQNRFSGWLLTKLGYIPVDRDNGKLAYSKAKEVLLSGKDIIIFPEGTLSKKIFTMDEIKTGLARLALDTNTTVVPIGVSIKKWGIIEHKYKNREGDNVLARWYIFNKYFVNVGKSIKLKGSIKNKKYVYGKSTYLKQTIQSLSRKHFYED